MAAESFAAAEDMVLREESSGSVSASSLSVSMLSPNSFLSLSVRSSRGGSGSGSCWLGDRDPAPEPGPDPDRWLLCRLRSKNIFIRNFNIIRGKTASKNI